MIISLEKTKFSYILFILLALVIVLDFSLPGITYTDKVIDIRKELQRYYNAGGNYHYSYRVFTTKHRFSVSEEFAQIVQENQEVQYQVSFLFEEVNSYRLTTSSDKNIYSLRFLSGLVIPLLTIIASVLGYKYRNKVGILAFVSQTLLIADLVFLII
ncbi:MAG: hypothetical protein AAF944_01150 [Bacteroidota bacterium]